MGSGINKRARDVIKPALERIEELERRSEALLSNQQNMMEAVNRALSVTQDRIEVMERLCNAFGEILGQEKVQEVVTKHIEEQAFARAEVEKKAIADGVDSGALKPREDITANSVITGREILKNGDIRKPGWQQLLVNQAREEIRALLVGKKVGDKIDVPAGQFEILEIYDIVEQAVAPASAPSPEETQAVADAAAAAVPGSEAVALPEISEEDADTALEEYMATPATTEPN